jgi:hypothetical protein
MFFFEMYLLAQRLLTDRDDQPHSKSGGVLIQRKKYTEALSVRM